MSEPLTGEKKQEPQVPEEVHERFVAGVQLAQRWGAGFGERRPGGVQINPVTGERVVAEEKPADEPEKKGDEEAGEAAEAAAATEEKPAEEPAEPPKNDALTALQRIESYVQRQQRQLASE